MVLRDVELLQPTFPLKCDFCGNKHEGGIDKAIDDGWYFSVLDTSQGTIQMAGCPSHKDAYSQKLIDYMHGLAREKHPSF